MWRISVCDSSFFFVCLIVLFLININQEAIWQRDGCQCNHVFLIITSGCFSMCMLLFLDFMTESVALHQVSFVWDCWQGGWEVGGCVSKENMDIYRGHSSRWLHDTQWILSWNAALVMQVKECMSTLQSHPWAAPNAPREYELRWSGGEDDLIYVPLFMICSFNEMSLLLGKAVVTNGENIQKCCTRTFGSFCVIKNVRDYTCL